MTKPGTSGASRVRKAGGDGHAGGSDNGNGTAARRRRATPREATLDVGAFRSRFDEIVANVESVVRGKTDVVRLALAAVLCEGHVLFEDVPGTGKSVLARALAQSIDADTARVQCTPDLLPADVTGASILGRVSGELEFRPGPIFTNVLLVDEINRATPKTQSALLEAMQERRVSADGETRPLPRPFVVLATQNPIEIAGTFPLPEAQLDRFQFRLAMGHLNRDDEFDVMFQNSTRLAVDDVRPVIGTKEVLAMIEAATRVEVADELGYYVVDLARASREDPAVSMGASSRATIAILRAARVLAAGDGRAHVYPDDILEVLAPVLAHRLVLTPEAVLRGESAETVVERVRAAVRMPISRSR